MSKLPTYDGMRAAMAMLPDGTALSDALRLLAAPAVLLPALIRPASRYVEPLTKDAA